jgi:ribosomal protein S18 acetylase RimI-like enzyme
MTAQVREASAADVPAMVEIHLRAFPDFFLSQLGRPFLRRLYAGFVREPSGCALIAQQGAAVVGYIAGTSSPERYFRERLHREGFAFACSALPGLLRAPSRTLERLWSALRYRGERPPDLAGGWLVSSVAVDPEVRAAGIGSALVRAFCAHAAAARARWVYLLTDESGNDPVQAFYERAGFHLHSRIMRGGGRVMRVYAQDPSKPEASHVH